jgi:hypothetical protein
MNLNFIKKFTKIHRHSSTLQRAFQSHKRRCLRPLSLGFEKATLIALAAFAKECSGREYHANSLFDFVQWGVCY